MRRYLKEFLSDERVIEVPRWKWWPILNLIILTVRPGRKGKDYATIWNNERDEGPLKTITRAQAEKLAVALGMPERVEVDWAMRYANPTDRQPHPRADGAGLRPHPAGAALSAVRRRDDGDGRRSGFPRADEDALAAGGARCARLSRRSRLYRRAGRLDARDLAKLDFEPETHHRHLPRHAAGLSRGGRPLLTASARRPRACCARRSAGPRRSG